MAKKQKTQEVEVPVVETPVVQKQTPKKAEPKEQTLDASKPITLDFLTNPDKE